MPKPDSVIFDTHITLLLIDLSIEFLYEDDALEPCDSQHIIMQQSSMFQYFFTANLSLSRLNLDASVFALV